MHYCATNHQPTTNHPNEIPYLTVTNPISSCHFRA